MKKKKKSSVHAARRTTLLRGLTVLLVILGIFREAGASTSNNFELGFSDANTCDTIATCLQRNTYDSRGWSNTDYWLGGHTYSANLARGIDIQRCMVRPVPFLGVSKSWPTVKYFLETVQLGEETGYYDDLTAIS